MRCIKEAVVAGQAEAGALTLFRFASSVRKRPMAANTRLPAIKRSLTMPFDRSRLLILIACKQAPT